MADIPMGHTHEIGEAAARADLRKLAGRRVSWSAIFAGLIIAAVLQVLLTVFGLAVGFSSLASGGEPGSVGVGTGIWAIISAIISLFVGALVTGRMASPRGKKSGVFHGFVLWGLSVVCTAWLVASGVTSLAAGAFQVTSSAIGGATAGVAQGATQFGGAAAANPEAARRMDSIRAALGPQADTAAERMQSAAGEVAMKASGAVSGAAWAAFIGLILTAAACAIGAGIATRESRNLEKDTAVTT